MFIVNSYALAVLFCFITMMCWGSWGNTQKLASKSWRYELFYWDYVIGMVLFTLVVGFTMGSIGSEGRSFLPDLAQADARGVGSVVLGGVIFNASNILLSASVAMAGLSVAFPLGVGLALVLGVVVNYVGAPKGDPVILFLGVALIVAAIVCNGIASQRVQSGGTQRAQFRKGVALAVVAGVLMSLFYRFVAAAMDLDHFENPTPGMLTPYSAVFIFSLGVLASNFVFNTWVMKRPFDGEPVAYRDYFKGSFSTHLVGMLGGAIWCLGTTFSYIAAGKAGAAVSYALGQGAPMVAAVWGVFVWKEFRGGGRTVNGLLALMFALTFGWPGTALSDLVEQGVGLLSEGVSAFLASAPAWIRALLVDGVLAGVGGVLVFLPQILIIFLFMSILEDSGYMSRAAFITDRLLRRFGLSGRSFIPMLMGFGCTTTAVIAARGVENERDRRMTILLTPFMSCGAKLPVYGLITAAIFPCLRADTSVATATT